MKIKASLYIFVACIFILCCHYIPANAAHRCVAILQNGYITTERTRIRFVEQNDFRKLAEVFLSKEGARLQNFNLSKEFVFSMFIGLEQKSKKIPDSDVMGLTVADIHTNEVLGIVMITEYALGQTGWIAYALHPSVWGKGIMTEVLDRTLDYAFEFLQLHTLYARVSLNNTASQRVLEKNGFISMNKTEPSLLKKYSIIPNMLDIIYEIKETDRSTY